MPESICIDSLPPSGDPDRAPCRPASQGSGVRVAADDTWSDIFSRLLSESVEPKLGVGRATHSPRLSGERGGARPD